jgi:hypothetical protein
LHLAGKQVSYYLLFALYRDLGLAEYELQTLVSEVLRERLEISSPGVEGIGLDCKLKDRCSVATGSRAF